MLGDLATMFNLVSQTQQASSAMPALRVCESKRNSSIVFADAPGVDPILRVLTSGRRKVPFGDATISSPACRRYVAMQALLPLTCPVKPDIA